MVRRVYTEISDSYAPFTNAVLQGLGHDGTRPGNGWPAGRSYVGIAHFRAPYDEFGYFQDNTLKGPPMHNTPVKNSYVSVEGLGRALGLGPMGAIDATELDALNQQAPGNVKRFLLAGDPVSSLRADVTLPFNQVHPYVYGGIALAALATSYLSYKHWKKLHGGGTQT